MKKYRLPIAALVLVGVLNVLGLIHIAANLQNLPSTNAQCYAPDDNLRVALPSWIGRAPWG